MLLFCNKFRFRNCFIYENQAPEAISVETAKKHDDADEKPSRADEIISNVLPADVKKAKELIDRKDDLFRQVRAVLPAQVDPRLQEVLDNNCRLFNEQFYKLDLDEQTALLDVFEKSIVLFDRLDDLPKDPQELFDYISNFFHSSELPVYLKDYMLPIILLITTVILLIAAVVVSVELAGLMIALGIGSLIAGATAAGLVNQEREKAGKASIDFDGLTVQNTGSVVWGLMYDKINEYLSATVKDPDLLELFQAYYDSIQYMKKPEDRKDFLYMFHAIVTEVAGDKKLDTGDVKYIARNLRSRFQEFMKEKRRAEFAYSYR